MTELTEREEKEVLLALIYASEAFSHGTVGHNGYMTLAKLAQQAGYVVGWQVSKDGKTPFPVLVKVAKD